MLETQKTRVTSFSYKVEPLYINGHLGDRRKWPLLRGGHCREVLNKSQSMDFLSAGTKKSGRCRCREVAVIGGSTVHLFLTRHLLEPVHARNHQYDKTAKDSPLRSTQIFQGLSCRHLL